MPANTNSKYHIKTQSEGKGINVLTRNAGTEKIRCGHNPARKDVKTMGIKITMAAARTNAGLSQKQLAEACGVSESAILNWEKGKNAPNLKYLPKLEQAYGISLDYVKIPY